MKTFNTFLQLSQARLLTGTPVTVLSPAKVEGVVQDQGEGLTLLSGNVFVPRFDDIEATTGRRTQILADEFPGNVSAKLNLFSRDSSGYWQPNEDGRTSTVFYAGSLWWPTTEVPYQATDYVISSWTVIGTDTLEVTTTTGVFFTFSRFAGLSTPAPDLVTPLSQDRQYGDGSTTVFTSPNIEQVDPANFLVVIDGFVQKGIVSYSVGPGQIQFTEAPPAGAEIDITYYYPIAVEGLEGVLPMVHPRAIGDGVTTEFTSPVTYAVNPASLYVVVDGLLQRPVTSYSVNSSGNVVFTEAPDEGVTIDVTYFKPSYNTLDPEEDLVINSVTASDISTTRSGSLVMTSGQSSAIIDFTNLGLTNLPNINYRVFLSTDGTTPVYWNSKQATGFEINRASSSSVQTVDWMVVR